MTRPIRKRRRKDPLLSSENTNWQTPQRIVDIVREAFGGTIDVDPCAGVGSLVGARDEMLLTDGRNGLVLPWRGRVFMNPPYGRGIHDWTTKARLSGAGGLAEVIGLVPGRVDTLWFRDVWAARMICFITGRLQFVGAPDPATFPSVLCHWGSELQGAAFAAACRRANLGTIVRGADILTIGAKEKKR